MTDSCIAFFGSLATRETGAGALNLNVGEQRYRELLLTGETKYQRALSDSLTLLVNAGVSYDFKNEQGKVASSFVGGGPTFVTTGLKSSPWIYQGGVGLVKDDKKGMTYSVRYDVEGRTSGYVNQTLSAKVRWAF